MFDFQRFVTLLQVGSVETFERQLEAAQTAFGWPPEEFVPVIYRCALHLLSFLPPIRFPAAAVRHATHSYALSP